MQLHQHIVAYEVVILHYQDGLVAARSRLGDRHHDRLRLLVGDMRQIQPDRRAVTFLAVGLDMAARLLDETIDHAQAEAGTLAELLGSEERLEHPVSDRRRNAGAVVAHRYHDVGTQHRFRIGPDISLVEHDIGALECQLAAVGHGVAGIDGEIDQRGGQLGRIGVGETGTFYQL